MLRRDLQDFTISASSIRNREKPDVLAIFVAELHNSSVAEEINNYDGLRAVLVLVATAAVIIFNAFAASGRLFGVDTGEVSARYPTVITPAGYAFSIWSLIYLGLVAFSIYQLLPAQLARFRGVRTMYLLSCVFNCGWLFAWHQLEIGISALLILGLLGTLAYINVKLRSRDSGLALIIAKATFGIYFGWVTAASFVNLLVYLKSAGVTMSPTAWNIYGIAVIALLLIASLIVRVTLRNFLYPVAIAWALTAIAIQQSGNTAVILAGAIAVILCLVLSLSFVMDLRHTRQ